MTDIIYYITDLSEEHKRKILLVDESKEGLISLISEEIKKPLFRLFIKDEEKHLLEEKIGQFKLHEFSNDSKFKMGDFLLQLEEAGEL